MSPGKLSVFVSCRKVIESQPKFPVFISHGKVIESSRQVTTRIQESCSTHQYPHFTKNTFSSVIKTNNNIESEVNKASIHTMFLLRKQ